VQSTFELNKDAVIYSFFFLCFCATANRHHRRSAKFLMRWSCDIYGYRLEPSSIINRFTSVLSFDISLSLSLSLSLCVSRIRCIYIPTWITLCNADLSDINIVKPRDQDKCKKKERKKKVVGFDDFADEIADLELNRSELGMVQASLGVARIVDFARKSRSLG